MRLLTAITIILAALVLGGCTTTGFPGGENWWTFNPQNHAGMTHVRMKGCPENRGATEQLFCDVLIFDGKEKTDVDVQVSRNPDGTLTATYTAKDVTAFEGQGIRADMERDIIDSMSQTVRDALKAYTSRLDFGSQ